MKKHFLFLISTVLFGYSFNLSSVSAKELRTDGKPGSEYADFSSLEGNIRFGAQFGAILPVSDRADSSFALGFDADYRPYDLFGIKANFLQGLKSPKISVVSVTPLAHTQYSNLTPFAFFGPGIAITNVSGTSIKFLLAGGAGADIELIDKLTMGLVWTYDTIFDSYDIHSVTARFGWKF
jgi:opacity protein-like surface antigen